MSFKNVRISTNNSIKSVSHLELQAVVLNTHVFNCTINRIFLADTTLGLVFKKLGYKVKSYSICMDCDLLYFFNDNILFSYHFVLSIYYCTVIAM